MDKSNALKKVLIVELIILFLAISFIPSAEAVVIKTGKNMLVEHTISEFYLPLNTGPEPIPFIEGSMGENGWYISEVIITFSYDPERVQEIQYFLNGQWHEYTESGIHVDEDGIYDIDWKWFDEFGKEHTGWPITFSLDKTPPTIQLTRKIQGNDVTFTADVNDPTSGVECAYQWVWTGTTSHSVYAIAYDYAGHSKKSETLSTPYNFFYGNSIVLNLLQQLLIMLTF